MRRNILLFLPLLVLAVILQTTIISRLKLLEGNADLIMLLLAAWVLQEQTKGSWVWGLLASFLVGLVSGIPWYIYTISYLIVVGFAQLVKRRIWEAPLLAMFLISAIGTFSVLLLTYVQISLFSTALSFSEVFGEIILPSLLFNLLVAIPVYATISSLAKRLLPLEAIK
jgi:rod shape-determining protein MreD